MNPPPPCVVFEDEHFLVVNKPPGWNTHAPSPWAGEGIHDWLRHREPRWADLAILHRLDKETSGVLVFGKTTLANRSLTDQFTARSVAKTYQFLTASAARPRRSKFTDRAEIVRSGNRYRAREWKPGAPEAVTEFRWMAEHQLAGRDVNLWEARPGTGRTHQIRVQATGAGLPVLGDALYGGDPCGRMCLHAALIAFLHPASGELVSFAAPADFAADGTVTLRQALFDLDETNCLRWWHGAADGHAGVYLEQLGDRLLLETNEDRASLDSATAERLAGRFPAAALFHKPLRRQVRQTAAAEASPVCLRGTAGGDPFEVRENGVRYELSLAEGYSHGLFLDQRDNRRRLLRNHLAAGEALFAEGLRGRAVLNAFAYTCGFSVCAALAGAGTTSLDLSKKYLDWGRRNFALNGLDPAGHDFIFGDVFDWLKRLARKGRVFDVVLLDPPTFSQSKQSGVFRAEKDYADLVRLALPLVKPGGILFASTNAARVEPAEFVSTVTGAVRDAGRGVAFEKYYPQPPDFPVTRDEPAHLKTLWLRVE